MPSGNGGIVGPVNTSFSGVWSLTEAQLRRSANTWPNFYAALLSESATGSDVFSGADAADPYFEYTTLLLPGNGTNGAQNNTFLDASTNNFTITRNGNTTQGTFSPFSQTGWGNYFNGSNAYLSVANSTDLQLGNSDWDIECWVYLTSTSGNQRVISQSDSNYEFAFYLSSGSLTAYSFQSGGTQNFAISMGTLSANQWYHIAATRSGSTVRAFVNGTQIGSATFSGTIDARTGGWKVGASYTGSELLNGYISNLRIVKGSPVYTSAFTPPVSPLTAITNTSLLTCQSNRFIDTNTQTTPKTITVSGSPSVQAFSPFNPTSSWSAATYGGSGYFDGNTDYLTYTPGSSFAFGTGDFTIEGWVNTESGNGGLVSPTSNGSYWDIRITGLSIYYQSASGITNKLVVTNVLVYNAWNHVAVVRSSGTSTIYVNGTSVGTVSDTTNYTATTTYQTGRDGDGTNTLKGYISNVRVVKGTAVYTGAFTPPIAPISTSGSASASAYSSTTNVNTSFASSETSLLLNFTNAGIYDATSKNDLETVGNAQISTAQSKWGGSSMAFDGTGDYLQLPKNDLTSFQTGDFTIECWLYLNANNIIQGIFSTGAYPSNQGTFRITTGGKLNFYVDNGGTVNLTGSTTVSTSTWHHVAVTRSGSTIRLFLNGTVDGSATSSASITGIDPVFVGREQTTNTLNGYIQDLRITKGYARYTANFTAPTAAFPTL